MRSKSLADLTTSRASSHIYLPTHPNLFWVPAIHPPLCVYGTLCRYMKTFLSGPEEIDRVNEMHLLPAFFWGRLVVSYHAMLSSLLSLTHLYLFIDYSLSVCGLWLAVWYLPRTRPISTAWCVMWPVQLVWIMSLSRWPR